MALHHHHVKEISSSRLKRTLSLFEVTCSGTGIILGAGIYALIGVASAYSGNSLWLAFVFAAVMAILTGLSHAELSSFYKSDSSEYEYTRNAFNRKIAFFLGMFVILSGILAVATVSIGFSNYLNALVGVPVLISAICLIILLSLVNIRGIRLSTEIMIVATFLEIVGIITIIILGIKDWGRVNLLSLDFGMHGVLQATALIFFAYLGFESIVKLEEETKNPQKTIPRALILSILIASVLYILTSISAISIMGYEKLSVSNAPLAEAASLSLGKVAFIIIAVIALFSTLSTVLGSMVATSRITYGLAKERALPEKMAEISKRTNTPIKAIIITSLIALAFLFFRRIDVIANLTNISTFITFAFVNLSLMILRFRVDPGKFKFRVKFLSIGRFSVMALLGFLTSLLMLVYSVINLS